MGAQWSPTTFAEWKLAQPRSFNSEGIQPCARAIYYLPQLSCVNIQQVYQPSYRIVAQPDVIKEIAQKAFSPPRATTTSCSLSCGGSR